jgi:translation initiation factor IF-3
MATRAALEQARTLDLDLVEVAPGADPPVVRIMDHGKFKYIQSKREQEARKKQTVILVKEIKVRPKTDDHDLETKIRHIRRFLDEGDKVKITVRFRGRELAYANQSGIEVLKFIVEQVKDLCKIESPPKMEGRTMMSIVSPLVVGKKKGPAAPAPAPPKGSEGAKTPETPATGAQAPPQPEN